jgi:hypothetical protein
MCKSVCLLLALLITAASASAQDAPKRMLFFTVTDPLNRFVTGLSANDFAITENGVRRPVTQFVNVDAPIAIAIVGDAGSSVRKPLVTPDDELIQTSSLSEALAALTASPHQRKALILAGTAEASTIPGGIFVIKVAAHAEAIGRAVVEVCNQYLVRFETTGTASSVEIVVNRLPALPSLKANWK